MPDVFEDFAYLVNKTSQTQSPIPKPHQSICKMSKIQQINLANKFIYFRFFQFLIKIALIYSHIESNEEKWTNLFTRFFLRILLKFPSRSLSDPLSVLNYPLTIRNTDLFLLFLYYLIFIFLIKISLIYSHIESNEKRKWKSLFSRFIFRILLLLQIKTSKPQPKPNPSASWISLQDEQNHANEPFK